MLRDPSRPLDVRELAGSVGLSVTQFRRLFRRQTGATPIRLLKAARMESAHELVIETNRQIKVIAFSAGFSDLSHFIRKFRHRYGAPPAELRRAVAGR